MAYQNTAEEFLKACYYHGSRNPDAVAYGTEFSHDAYLASRIIAEPCRLFDCSRENDGAGAVLLVSAEHARDLTKPPVYLLGATQGTGKGWGDLLDNDENYASAGFDTVARRLWEQTDLTPADIDVAQIYENFSAQGVASLIDHGFCTYDNVAEFVRFDNLIAPGGGLPVNTHGGNTAQGFIHGIGMAIEAVRSLRGESPIRCQMPGPACWRAVPGHRSSVPPSSAMALLWTDRSLHRDSEASR